MQNEVELKIMLSPENIELIKMWLDQQNIVKANVNKLGNTYFDTPEQYFAKNKMGFRVRSYNDNYEMTLKMKGDIMGGLHIRPEYNLPLETQNPDFKRLNSHFNLQIAEAERIAETLIPIFSTDFTRHKWLILQNETQIEVVLDIGTVKNSFGSLPICELEFELLSGKLNDIFALIDQMPKRDGMWLSSLSKAQRGYFVGKIEHFKSEILQALKNENGYTLEQQLADYLREVKDKEIIAIFYQTFPEFADKNIDLLENYLKSEEYLERNLNKLRQLK